MNNDCCPAGCVLLLLSLLAGNVWAMDVIEVAAAGDDDWSIVSAPPPPGPYRSINIDPRIPGQDAVSMPGVGRELSTSGFIPAEALRTPPAAGGAAPLSGGYPSSQPRSYSLDKAPAAAQQQEYVQPRQSGAYQLPPPPPGNYAPMPRSGMERASPYSHDQGPVEQGFNQPPPYAPQDTAAQPVPGPYGQGMRRPPATGYSWPGRYSRQPDQQSFRMMPPPGYYPPSSERPLQDAPHPPIYDSMMGQPSGGNAVEDASRGDSR